MTRKRIALATLATLLIATAGTVIYEAWPLSSTVEANNLTQAQSDQIYREISATRGSLVEGGRLLSKISKVTGPSVVHIQSQRNTGRSTVEETGSGVIVTSQHAPGLFVVTNRHVVLGAELGDIELQLADGRIIHPTRLWKDKDTDLAILKINVSGVQPARWGDSDQVDIGHMVLAMGSPFGLSKSVTYGIISAKGRRSLALGKDSEVLNQNFLQTDAAINPGNSGGPLVDLKGQIIGINTAIASNSGGNEGIGFSIPSNLVQRVFEELLQYGKVRRAYLGVKLDPRFDIDAARKLGLDRVRGARVLQVYQETPAFKAGLKFDDVVLYFGNHPVEDENDLINRVSLTPIGRRVELVVMRGRRQIKLYVTLADRESLNQQSSLPTRKQNASPMGLTVHRMNSDLSRQLSMGTSAQGLLIMEVGQESPWQGTLELYDVIEEVAGVPVHSAEDFEQVLEDNANTKSLLLKVRRRTEDGSQSQLLIWNPPAE